MGYVARKDGYKQGAQARRLLANVSVAPHVLNGTVAAQGIDQVVSYRIATESVTVGSLTVAKSQGYYLVECKVAPGRYYAVVRDNGDYTCSIASDARLLAVIVAKIIEYRTAPVLTEAQEEVAA
ncbi:MAG: hypothetical protein ACR2H5_14365 [Ktedonobacteraceae bacterium]